MIWTLCDQRTELLPIATKSADALHGRCTSVANIRAEDIGRAETDQIFREGTNVYLCRIFNYFRQRRNEAKQRLQYIHIELFATFHQQDTFAEYLSPFLEVVLFPCPNLFTPSGPLLRGRVAAFGRLPSQNFPKYSVNRKGVRCDAFSLPLMDRCCRRFG